MLIFYEIGNDDGRSPKTPKGKKLKQGGHILNDFFLQVWL